MSEATGRGFGWRRNPPDVRDTKFRFGDHAERLGAERHLPSKTDNWQYCPPTRDQGAQNSCTGHMWANIAGFHRRTDRFVRDTIYSSRYPYWWARHNEGPEWVTIDAGAYIRFGADVLRQQGIPPESKCRYLEHDHGRKPPISSEDDAQRWKAERYYHCYSLYEIKTALAARLPVAFGFACYSNMFTHAVDETGFIPMPSGALEGWHAVYAHDYDDDLQGVWFGNSWGNDWGRGARVPGHGLMPYAYLSSPWLAADFTVVTGESVETAKG